MSALQLKKICKNGHQYGLQRFVCNDCKKNLKVSAGFAIAHLQKKELLKAYIPHFLNGYSLVKCTQLTAISKQTSFDWRHKILFALSKQQQEITLSGICETDDFFLEYSEKGNQNLTREQKKTKQKCFCKKEKRYQ